MTNECCTSEFIQSAAIMTAAAMCLSTWFFPFILRHELISKCHEGIQRAVAVSICTWNSYCATKLFGLVKTHWADSVDLTCTTYLLLFCISTITTARFYVRDDPADLIIARLQTSVIGSLCMVVCLLQCVFVGIVTLMFPAIMFTNMLHYGGCYVSFSHFLNPGMDAAMAVLGILLSHGLAASGCRILRWYSGSLKSIP